MNKHLILSLFFFSFFFTSNAFEVVIKNPSSQLRTNETVEIEWKTVAKHLHLKSNEPIIVVNTDGQEFPSQIIYKGKKSPQALLFQVSISAKQSLTFMIQKGIPQSYPKKSFGRFVPERKDDYAWENDRVAFRIYGPALIKTDGPSNGIDIWCKRTSEMIINDRYEKELSGNGSYHIDWGNGLDFYKVGRTLGAGAMAPYVKDSLWLASNFIKQETLDNGPIRTTFRLTYSPFNVAGKLISETRTISLDAGSQFNKIEEEFIGLKTSIPVVAGIIMRNSTDSVIINKQKGYAIYIEPKSEQNGNLYLAVISSKPWDNIFIKKQHLCSLSTYQPKTNFSYYAGNGWSKWGFESTKDWLNYVSTFAYNLRIPLKIRVN
ncbi:MAG: DUF4861 family protein [Bacteroidales bacterium]|nr:DUF4861 family protein [Bacteroidales bacterium]